MPSDQNNGLNDLVSDKDDDMAAATAAMKDRVRRMAAGEDVPFSETTPAEDRYVKGLIGAAAGSVAPDGDSVFPKLGKMFYTKAEPSAINAAGDTIKTQIARGTSDTMADMAQEGLANATDVVKSQQGLSRAMDMQQRNAAALKAARLKALNKGY